MLLRLLLAAMVAVVVAAGAPAADIEERRSIGSVPAHVAAAFDEMAACQVSAAGDYLIFDRRGHAVYSFAPGADSAKKIVQIGAETGRILHPSAFDAAPDGSFIVADFPRYQPRIQFFTDAGNVMGGFTMAARPLPQITLGDLVLSGIGSLRYTGKNIILNQPEIGALVTELQLNGAALRTFGDLRATGQEQDPAVHAALNTGWALPNPKGGYYFVFRSGVPMFRKYDTAGALVFERHIEGVEMDPYLTRVPTTWPRRTVSGTEYPIVPAMIRTAAVDPDGNLWISLVAPYTYVYDAGGDKRRTIQFRAAGITTPTAFFFTKDRRLLVTPGCYAFDARL